MMKKVVCLLLTAFAVLGCSVQNRIVVTENEEDGLKKIRLVQSPEVRVKSDVTGQYGAPIKDVSLIYLFEEKSASRPQATLEMDFSTALIDRKAKGFPVMVLDNEPIALDLLENVRDSLIGGPDSAAIVRLEDKYLLPENLWLPMVHANEISFHFIKEEGTSVHFLLNQKEKDMLWEFLKMAIRQRDLRFPAVPEGQVKW